VAAIMVIVAFCWVGYVRLNHRFMEFPLAHISTSVLFGRLPERRYTPFFQHPPMKELCSFYSHESFLILDYIKNT
jgi:hypothetical protein